FVDKFLPAVSNRADLFSIARAHRQYLDFAARCRIDKRDVAGQSPVQHVFRTLSPVPGPSRALAPGPAPAGKSRFVGDRSADASGSPPGQGPVARLPLEAAPGVAEARPGPQPRR